MNASYPPVLQMKKDGAEFFEEALTSNELNEVKQLAKRYGGQGPGIRLAADPMLDEILSPKKQPFKIAERFLGPGARPVRALLFDKTAGSNWALGWHQDRTIAVREKLEEPGFEIWTRKSGLHHVEPPFSLLEHMITLRIHVDDTGADNAPLKIVLGSHAVGRVALDEIPGVVERGDIVDCLAIPGDIWAYATPILHASDASRSLGHRRVLQVDWSKDNLPGKLQWCGV